METTTLDNERESGEKKAEQQTSNSHSSTPPTLQRSRWPFLFSHEGFLRNIVYWVSQTTVRWWLFFWVYFKSIGSQENVPATGGCILAANHASYLDPPVVGCGLTHRVVHFMARDTLYKNRFVRWFFLQLRTFPIDRTKGDVGALRKALNHLREGHVVSLFPEGTRTSDGNLQAPKGGIGFLIAKAAVPVVPVYIEGTFTAYPRGAKRVRRTPVTIRYGKPILPEELQKMGNDRSAYEKIGKLVMERISSMKSQESA